MNSEKDLSQKITEITMLIANKHPELSKYIAEMPITIGWDAHQEIDTKTLENYLNSLQSMLSKYEFQINQKKGTK